MLSANPSPCFLRQLRELFIRQKVMTPQHEQLNQDIRPSPVSETVSDHTLLLSNVAAQPPEFLVLAGGRIVQDAPGLIVDALTQHLKQVSLNGSEILPIFFRDVAHLHLCRTRRARVGSRSLILGQIIIPDRKKFRMHFSKLDATSDVFYDRYYRSLHLKVKLNGSIRRVMKRTKFKDWREARRKRALDLHEQGWTGRAIAHALGVSEAAVCRWLAAKERKGRDAWRAKSRGHKAARLNDKQRRLIPDLLSHGAEADGFRGQLWTGARVAEVIRAEFSVSYHKAHVSRILKALKWTPQLPAERDERRDEKAISCWRIEVWPELEKRLVKTI